MHKARPVLGLVCAVALAVWLMAWLGQSAMRTPDVDAARVRGGAVLGYLREGQTFWLADAYPGDWDAVEFAPSWDALSRRSQRMLIDFDRSFARRESPVMVLWHEGAIRDAHILPIDADGYPRFADGMGEGSFRLTREEARFTCTFVRDETGNYYLCVPQGEAA